MQSSAHTTNDHSQVAGKIINSKKCFDLAWRPMVFIISVAAGLTPGCAADVDFQEPSARQSQELAYYTSFTYWALGEEIPVCFTGPNTADRNLAQQAIEDSWGVAANLTFNFTGTCPATIPTSTFSIYLREFNTPTWWGGMGQPGKNSRLPTNLADWSFKWEFRGDLQVAAFRATGTSDDFYRRIIVHEVGHALGFYHEHYRDDNLGLCPEESGSNTTEGWITEYDPISIMSGCANFYGRDDDDFSLSPLDTLGAEIMYPHDLNRKPVLQKAFSNGDGTAYVARTNLVYGLVPDWVARGANPEAMSSVLWWQSGQLWEDTPTVQVIFLAQGPRVYEVMLTDVRGVQHVGRPDVTVVADNSKHTAIVVSAL